MQDNNILQATMSLIDFPDTQPLAVIPKLTFSYHWASNPVKGHLLIVYQLP